MPKDLLTLAELAVESGIPRHRLLAHCAPKGDLPVLRLSRREVYVRREDWTAWVDRHRVGPTDQPQVENAVRRASVRHLPGAERYAQ